MYLHTKCQLKIKASEFLQLTLWRPGKFNIQIKDFSIYTNMFTLLVFDQLCANVALERSAHSVQPAPFGSWLYVSSLNTGSNIASLLSSLNCLWIILGQAGKTYWVTSLLKISYNQPLCFLVCSLQHQVWDWMPSTEKHNCQNTTGQNNLFPDCLI